MKYAIAIEGELLDEHTIHIDQALKGVSGKFKLIVELPWKTQTISRQEEFRQYFMNINIDTSEFKFNREEANER